MSNTIDTARMAGSAFTVAKVRYSSGSYSATIVRGDDTYRARVSYSHEIGGGARNAVRAAVKAFEKCLAEHDGLRMDGDYVAVPGDLDNGAYVFTFVPARWFAV